MQRKFHDEEILEEKSCCSRLKKIWNGWTSGFWMSHLNSKNALKQQNRCGYIIESINTLLPISDVLTCIADYTSLSSVSWIKSCYAFAKEPTLGLTWGGLVAALPFAGWLAHVDVQCHAAQSLFITKKSETIPEEKKEAKPNNVVLQPTLDLEAQTKVPLITPNSFFADKPNDFLVQNILKKGTPIFVTQSQFRLAKWHFFKDTVEKINPPLIGLKIIYGAIKLIPFLDVDSHIQENTSPTMYVFISVSIKLGLYICLYHFASRASRLQFENTIESFEEINRERQLVTGNTASASC